MNNFEGNGLLVQRAQEAVAAGAGGEFGSNPKVLYELLSKIISKLEAAGCSIEEASTLVNGLNLGQAPALVKSYIVKRLEKTTLCTLCK